MDRAKEQFLEHIATLFNSRRYYHVIMAADFYRRIFEEGEYPVSVAQQVNAALEANREVANAVAVFRYKTEKNEIVSASARLQEAFQTNEFHTQLLMLERPLKEKVAQLNSKLNRVQNLVEARDFNNLEKILAEMKGVYADFDATKPLALVNSIKLESQLRLGKAKLMAQQGNLNQAMEEFQAAAEAWPSNPDVLTAAGTFFNSQDFVNQSMSDFDRMFSEENFRGIYEKQYAIAPAIKGDATREIQFKSVLERVKKAEMASEKANLLMLNGDVFGAWETIELAAEDWPEDKKLNKMRAELAGRGADFVSAINKARDAEAKKEYGYSLSWYVNAQRSYPASQIANNAIKRISSSVLQSSPAGS
ncbi:MAG: hypothetical protein HC904_15050 [Blastochloris sp.]|nr:hypothetical protein [Blastochloris sp.]